MNSKKAALSTTLAITGLLISAGAFAMPDFPLQAPMSSVELCVAEIGKQANYDHAVRVRHEVDSKERRVGGHTIIIDTKVFAADSTRILREYETVCAVSAFAEIKLFKNKEKSIQ
jgi:hypothetical protein